MLLGCDDTLSPLAVATAGALLPRRPIVGPDTIGHEADQNNQAPRAMNAATNTMITTSTISAELIRR